MKMKDKEGRGLCEEERYNVDGGGRGGRGVRERKRERVSK